MNEKIFKFLIKELLVNTQKVGRKNVKEEKIERKKIKMRLVL